MMDNAVNVLFFAIVLFTEWVLFISIRGEVFMEAAFLIQW